MKDPESFSSLPSGIRLGLACVAMTAVAFGAPAFTDHGSVERLLIMAIVVGLTAALIPGLRYAAAAGLLGYLIYIGFLVNQYGELNWHEHSAAGHLMVFGLAFCLGRGQLWIRSGLAALPQELSGSSYEGESQQPSKPRQNSAAERMDAVKSTPASVPHRVSF